MKRAPPLTPYSSLSQEKNFTFKCHRLDTEIYSVNAMAFHNTFGTFVTAGSDGTYNFWDKDSKQRLKAQAKAAYPSGQPAPITCGAFDRSGQVCVSSVARACPRVRVGQRHLRQAGRLSG